MVKKEKRNEFLRQAMIEACNLQREELEHMAVPPIPAAFDRQMRMITRQHDRKQARKRSAIRWSAAAAAVIIVGVIGTTSPAVRQFANNIAHRLPFGQSVNRPDVTYTISEMPSQCKQVFQQTSSTMSYTRWEDADNCIVLIQENVQMDNLLNKTEYTCTEVRSSSLSGTVYLRDNCAAVIWNANGYSFMVMIKGPMANADTVIHAAESLSVTL